jgi:hypothetical protein
MWVVQISNPEQCQALVTLFFPENNLGARFGAPLLFNYICETTDVSFPRTCSSSGKKTLFRKALGGGASRGGDDPGRRQGGELHTAR